MRRMLSSGIALSVCAAAVLAPPLRQVGDKYADRVVDFKAGDPSNPQLADTGTVLGPPDFNADSLSGFLTLGVGGSVTVEFVDNLAVDGPGADILVWGDPANDEQVKAEVSEDGQTYHSFGAVGETCQLDLAQVGLKRARFVRITDDGSANQGVSPGAELDAVEALHSAAPSVGGAPVSTASGPATAAAASTATLPPTSSLSWVRTGGPLGGLGYDVRMMPGDPDSMLVSDAWAGTFASSDGGANWQPSSTGITVRVGATGDAIPVFCLTIDPGQPSIVWAGTQNKRGIFRSADGGRTWQEADRGVVEQNGITFRGFAVDPANSDIVYAAAEISSWEGGRPERRGREFDMTSGVVYKTTNRGRSWQAVWRGDNLARYVWIDPRDPNVLYVSTGIFDREAANSDPAAGTPGGEGVLKSTDGGLTWSQANSGLQNLYVGSLFMNPANPDLLLAGTGNNQYRAHSGVYLTTDGGASWTHTLSTGEDPVEAVEYTVSDPQVAYAAGAAGVYRSQDGGRTWQQVAGGEEDGWGPPGVRAGFPIDLQVDPRNPDRLFANAYGGGNFLSEDSGRTWTVASRGYTGSQVRALAIDPSQPGRVIAAARSGLFVSLNGGTDWQGLSNPPVVTMEWNAVAIDPADPGHIVSGTNWNNRLVNSRDGGASWQVVSTLGGRIGWGVIAFAPSDPATIYAGSTGYFSAGSFDPAQPGGGIFVSHSGGDSWVPANDPPSGDASVFGLAVDPYDPQRVLAATANHGLLSTVDGGRTWQEIKGGLPRTQAFSVAISPAEEGLVLAGFVRRALYRSTNGGADWVQSAQGMSPEAQITSIVFDPNGQAVYAADLFGGVYRSTNGGRTWSLINHDLLNRSVVVLALSGDGSHLYAGTEGGGVYRLDLNGQPPVPAEAPTPLPSTSLPPTFAQSATSAQPATSVPPTGRPGICGGALLPLSLLLPLGGRAWRRRDRQ